MSAYLGPMAMAVTNHLWQSTIVIAAAWLLTLMLRTNTARTRQRIWMAASLKFMLPFSLLVTAGSHMVGPRPAAQSSPAIYAAMDQWAQPAPAIAAAVQPAPTGLGASAKRQSIVRDAAPMMLTAVWLCGFAVVVSIWAVRWRRLTRVKRAAIQMPEGRETAALLRVQQRSGTRSAIRMMRCEGETGQRLEPGVMGVRSLVLLWPDGISERLSDAQLETVLAHEMQHVKHRDNLMAMLHMVVEAVFWFHPLVWWMEARLLQERERACDEEVLRMGNEPAVYAQSILKTCEFCVESPMACVAGITGAELKKRIVQIMSRRLGRELSLTKKVLLASAAALVVAGPLVFGLVYAPQVRAQNANGVGAGAGVSFAAYDVVSVKPAHPERLLVVGLQEQPDGIHGETVTVAMMVQEAYGSRNMRLSLDDEVTGLPDWGKGDYFAVDARMSPEQIAAFKTMDKDHQRACRQTMLQALLADRFKLKVHHVTRQVLGYQLVVANGGPKFKESSGSDTNTPIGPNGKHLPNVMQIVQSESGPELVLQNYSMELLANFLTSNAGVGHKVVDKTGLNGTYSYTLKYALSQGVGPAGGPADAAAPAPTLFNALEDQLGLKLQRGTDTIDTVVVDHVERPSSN